VRAARGPAACPGGLAGPRRLRDAGLALLAALAWLAGGCVSGPQEQGPDGRGAVDAAAAEVREAFESAAGRARDDLEEARRAAESILKAQAGRVSEAAARQAREQARRALRQGSEVLREAARRGSSAAEGWARLIQDRMVRLEESLDAMTRAGEEHADS
jgi:hypothetical protein